MIFDHSTLAGGANYYSGTSQFGTITWKLLDSACPSDSSVPVAFAASAAFVDWFVPKQLNIQASEEHDSAETHRE